MPLPSPDAFADALLLSGPTASGKTAVALEMADRLGAEIVSVDAITVYRGLDIGSAKPTPAEQARVRHHLIDVLWPWEAGSVAAWLERAAIACADIRARGRRILVVGGTPLYLKAMLRGLFAGPTADRDLRAQLEALPLGELQVKLAAVDPRAVDRIAAADRKRLVRALEVWELTGRPISDWQQQFDQPRPRTRPGFWLDWPRSDLHDRINRRVETMFAAGLVDECRRLVELDRPLAREVKQAAGYAEALAHLRGELTLAEAVTQTQTRTRQLAKRQITWLRHLVELQPLPVQTGDTPAALADRLLAQWQLA